MIIDLFRYKSIAVILKTIVGSMQMNSIKLKFDRLLFEFHVFVENSVVLFKINSSNKDLMNK